MIRSHDCEDLNELRTEESESTKNGTIDYIPSIAVSYPASRNVSAKVTSVNGKEPTDPGKNTSPTKQSFFFKFLRVFINGDDFEA